MRNAVALKTSVILAHAGIQSFESNAGVGLSYSLPRVLNVLFRALRATRFSNRRSAGPAKSGAKGLPLPWPSAALQVPSLRRRSGGRTRRPRDKGHPWPDTPFAAPGRSTPYASTPLGLR